MFGSKHLTARCLLGDCVKYHHCWLQEDMTLQFVKPGTSYHSSAFRILKHNGVLGCAPCKLLLFEAVLRLFNFWIKSLHAVGCNSSHMRSRTSDREILM